ncbi:hypothetical protein [Streptomyces hydrogenans]
MADFEAGVARRTSVTALLQMADEYVAQVHSIIEINRSIIPEMAAKNESLADDLRDSIISQLSDDERVEYADYLEKIGNGIASIADVAKKGARTRGDNPPFSLQISNPTIGSAIMRTISESAMQVRAGSSDEMLRKSLLVSAISTFEVLFGQLARIIYSVNSAALNDSDYAFTLQELANFSTLDDAREYLVERRISALMRDSIDAWDKWLKRSSGGLSMNDLPVEWPVIRESFARRNLIVHTGGVVNHLYTSVIQNLDLSEDARPAVGARLTVDEEYLNRVLQELLALGYVMVSAVGAKLHKGDSAAFDRGMVGAIESLAMKRTWRACAALCQYALSRKLTRSREMMVTVRSWLARREIYGIESIRQEVEQWDTSGLSRKISHCKPVLLREADSALPPINHLLESGDLTRFELALDPLYDGILESMGRSGTDRSS